MKKCFISMFLLCSISFTAVAQIPIDKVVSVPGIGSALSTLGKGLNAGSLLSSFKLPDWLGSVSKLKATDAIGAASLLGKLGKGLNPASLTKGFSLSDWSSKLKTASTISSVAKEAESLAKNIKPDAFKPGFDVSTVTSALALLQK